MKLLRRWRRRCHDVLVASLRGSTSSVDSLVDRRQPVLSQLYGLVVARRRRRDASGPQRVAPPHVPVISVGNVTFGATGKTPLELWLVDYVLNRGRNHVPLLLSRGYGDDEWRLFASRYPACQLALGGDRVAAGRAKVEALKTAKVEVSCVLLDDGLQQWRLQKDLEIVMVDALHPLGNGLLLPWGSLRELPIDAFKRADVVIVHHADLLHSEEKARELMSSLRRLMDERRRPVVGSSRIKVVGLEPATRLLKGELGGRVEVTKEEGVSSLDGRAVLVLCGVGNPESVKLVVEKLEKWKCVDMKAFPDHHSFSEGDVDDVLEWAYELQHAGQYEHNNVVVVTTEKDFARSPSAMEVLAEKLDLRVLHCELELLHNVLEVKQRIDLCLDRITVKAV